MSKLTRRMLVKMGYRLRRSDPHQHGGAAKRWLKDPQNPCLISFPRTGSHWLRMIIELYFEQPLLVRTFYYPGRRDFLLLHDHDMDLQLASRNVLYLFREPVDTVFSQLSFYREPLDHPLRIAHWSMRYGLHLSHWLLGGRPMSRLTVLRYEQLKADLPGAFAAVCEHFGQTLDEARLAAAAAKVTRGEVKEKSQVYNDAVMTLGESYEQQRERFRAEQSGRVWEALAAVSQTVHGDPQRIASLFT
jgi:hypothetical protein